VVVGKNRWPFPVPIVREGKAWRFDGTIGREEIGNRRVGRNEIFAIQVCRAFVLAQREYASKDRDGDGVLEYAQRIVSTRLQQDGLYWEAREGSEPSPMGPLLAAAATGEPITGVAPKPFHGYHYKLLTAQGKSAPGGEKSYLKNAQLVDGFALLAYPAEYGKSGVMSFTVNHRGVIFEQDLGKDTLAIAEKVTQYDPDSNWLPVPVR
jgi:hypothetical protein